MMKRKVGNDKPSILAIEANHVERRSLDKVLVERRRHKERKRNIIRSILAILLFALLATCFSFYVLGKASEERAEPSLYTIKEGSLKTTIDYQGRVKSSDDYKVSPLVMGSVDEVYVSVGDEVDQGSPLFKVTNAEMKQMVEKAEQDVLFAQQERELVAQRLEEEELHLDELEASFAASHEQSGDDVAGEVERAAIAADIEKAQTAVKSYEFELQKADQGVSQATASRDTAFNYSESGVVRSPGAGVVTELSVSVGANTSSVEGYAARITNLSNLKLEVDVSELDIAYLTPGDSVEITSSLKDDVPFMGVIDSVASVSSQAGSAAGESSGHSTYRVVITMPEAPESIKEGMLLNAKFLLKTVDGIIIPREALSDQDGETKVIVKLQDNRYVSEEVVVLGTSGQEAVVQGNLSEGQEILLTYSEQYLELKK